ncbi:hypothetical protein H6P81_001907 [Aristolochia fimbriata]|uniref:MADS-box domain-containing protein n=1 Tax=Aristolochia fimbriata TaxID=158543 RepID=A0AAV7F9T1_ARIFI|nr:hypothetical protein H6P81_001907 [Aristolochia fimbriata]
MGKRKIDIRKIEDLSSRQVTFSKRRQGLFRKAADFCLLSAAQMAIIVNSPGGKPYLFSHPPSSADQVIDQYLHEHSSQAIADRSREEPNRLNRIDPTEDELQRLGPKAMLGTGKKQRRGRDEEVKRGGPKCKEESGDMGSSRPASSPQCPKISRRAGPLLTRQMVGLEINLGEGTGAQNGWRKN